MPYHVLAILGVLAVGVLFVVLPIALMTLSRRREQRFVLCPETGRPAGVHFKAGAAARGALFCRVPLSVERCSRWPERQDCGQECTSQIEEAPDGWLVRERLTQQYRDAPCVLCGKTIGAIRFERKPGLLTPDQTTIDWSGIKPEDLPTLLATHEPICWNCHLAESFHGRLPGRGLKNPPRSVSPESDTKPLW